MLEQSNDLHEQYFEGAQDGFDRVCAVAGYVNGSIADTLVAIRDRVLDGGFPVNMDVVPYRNDALGEDMVRDILDPYIDNNVMCEPVELPDDLIDEV